MFFFSFLFYSSFWLIPSARVEMAWRKNNGANELIGFFSDVTSDARYILLIYIYIALCQAVGTGRIYIGPTNAN
jgi:hypothetical protein